MGVLLSCRLPCNNGSSSSDDKEFVLSEEQTSLASQPSLPSVPSLHTLIPSNATQNDAVSVPVKITVTTIAVHSSYISSLVLAGKFLFSSSSDGTVRLHNRLVARSVAVSQSAIRSLAVSGDKLFTAHHDHKIRVWKIDLAGAGETDFKCVATLPTLADRVSRLFSAENYVTVRRHVKRTWVHHNDAVSALAVAKDGSVLYSASWDRSFKVWRCSDFKCLESVPNAHDDAVNAVALTADGYVYTGSADRRIKVWRRGHDGHSLVETLEKHRSAVNALALTADGRVLYSGACDRSILVWERLNDMKMVVVGALRGHGKAILSLAVESDLVCSGSADCTVRVWKRSPELGLDGKPSYACLAVLEGHRRPVKCLSLGVDHSNTTSDGSSYLVYSGGLDCEIKAWKICVPS